MKINCIAIDDEPLALDKIVSFIEKIDYLKLTKTFDNAYEAITYLKNSSTDLMFLDIQMDDFSGIQLLQSIQNKPKVILTTAYDSYAIKGYELGVNDYLLKPISFTRFTQAVEKVYNLIQNERVSLMNKSETTDDQTKKEFVFIKDGHKIVKVRFDEILYIEGMKDYLLIRTLRSKIHTLMNFKNMDDILPERSFVRVHKSYIIALDKIEVIEGNQIKISDVHIPIGSFYKKSFLSRISS